MLILVATLPACVTVKMVGGYEINGQVVDADSLVPLAGVVVAVRFEALSAYSNNSRVVATSESDRDGRYRLHVPVTRMRGGTGGWSGYIASWPSVRYSKAGYCTTIRSSLNPSLSSYQDVVMRLNPNRGHCVEPE